MQQDADGLEAVGFAAAEQFVPVKAQQAVLGVFAAIQQ